MFLVGMGFGDLEPQATSGCLFLRQSYVDERTCDQLASLSCLLLCLHLGCHEPHTGISLSSSSCFGSWCFYHSGRKVSNMVGFSFTVIPDGSDPGRLRDVNLGLLSTAFRNYGFSIENTLPK